MHKYAGMTGRERDGCSPFIWAGGIADEAAAKEIAREAGLLTIILYPKKGARSTHRAYRRDDSLPSGYRTIPTRVAVFRTLLDIGEKGIPTKEQVAA